MRARTPDRAGKPYRLTVRQFLEMIRLGVFPDDARVELLKGILIEHPKRSPGHDHSAGALGDQLCKCLPPPWCVREGGSLELGRVSRVEPDIALIRGPEVPDRALAPRAGEAGLLIEVADATYPYDRGVKLRAYASAMIPIYWIVDLPKRRIEVHRDPVGRGKAACYREVSAFGPDSEVPLVLEGREVARLSVKDILPRP